VRCLGKHADSLNPITRHCEERKRRSNPFLLSAIWIASLRSQ
jgi:hypothetical protein